MFSDVSGEVEVNDNILLKFTVVLILSMLQGPYEETRNITREVFPKELKDFEFSDSKQENSFSKNEISITLGRQNIQQDTFRNAL